MKNTGSARIGHVKCHLMCSVRASKLLFHREICIKEYLRKMIFFAQGIIRAFLLF